MKHLKWRGLCGILSLAASLTLLGCGASGNSYVRVVNASSGLSNNTSWTIQAGQTGIVSSLPFGTEGVQQQGQYVTTDTSGNYRPLGAAANQSLVVYSTPGTDLTSTTQSFLKNTYYTIVVLTPMPNIMTQTLTDNDAAPSSGTYNLRVMDTSTMAGPVDVYVTGVGSPVSGSPLVGNISFQQVVTLPQLSPGTFELQVTPTGNPSKVLAIQPFSPASGKLYSIFVLDPPNVAATIQPPGMGTNSYGVLVVNDPVAPATK
ncbi:MAG: DUF4397 domain-containing protein [Acidobacteriaceae bacterium]